MSSNIQIIANGDWSFTINMRGKTFTVVVDEDKKIYEIQGKPPKDVQNNHEKFIDWLFKKLNLSVDKSQFHRLN